MNEYRPIYSTYQKAIPYGGITAMIETLAGLVTTVSDTVAVWRHFFTARLAINLTVLNTFLGETSCDGRQMSTSVSYNFRLTNYGNNDIQIAKFSLRRRFIGLCWCKASNSEIDPDSLPFRLPPSGNMDIWITIERGSVGTHRLIVREYGSRRLAKFMLPELERAPSAAHS